MKHLFRIFELSRNEQRVVLIVMLVLIATALVGYERRIHRFHIQPILTKVAKPSPSPVKVEDQR